MKSVVFKENKQSRQSVIQTAAVVHTENISPGPSRANSSDPWGSDPEKCIDRMSSEPNKSNKTTDRNLFSVINEDEELWDDIPVVKSDMPKNTQLNEKTKTQKQEVTESVNEVTAEDPWGNKKEKRGITNDKNKHNAEHRSSEWDDEKNCNVWESEKTLNNSSNNRITNAQALRAEYRQAKKKPINNDTHDVSKTNTLSEWENNWGESEQMLDEQPIYMRNSKLPSHVLQGQCVDGPLNQQSVPVNSISNRPPKAENRDTNTNRSNGIKVVSDWDDDWVSSEGTAIAQSNNTQPANHTRNALNIQPVETSERIPRVLSNGERVNQANAKENKKFDLQDGHAKPYRTSKEQPTANSQMKHKTENNVPHKTDVVSQKPNQSKISRSLPTMSDLEHSTSNNIPLVTFSENNMGQGISNNSFQNSQINDVDHYQLPNENRRVSDGSRVVVRQRKKPNAWDNKTSDKPISRIRTPVKELKIQQEWTAIEIEPVMDTDRLSKKFPFLDIQPNIKTEPSQTNAKKQTPTPEHAAAFVKAFDTSKENTNALDDKNSQSNKAQIFYGFGVGRFRKYATAWLAKFRAKKAPVETVPSVWN